MSIRQLDFYFVVAGLYLPAKTAKVSKGSNGSQSTVQGTASISILRAQGIDMFQESQGKTGCEIDVYGGFDGKSKRLFSGTIDEWEPDFDGDLITISGRDFASVIVDTKETTSTLDYKNKTIGQMVEAIANKFEFAPKVTDPGIMAGAQLWDDSAYMPHGQQYWTMLQDLARHCGYECFVTDDKELFFGASEDAAGDDLTVTHAPDPNGGQAENPITKLKPKYAPGRNSNVEVCVLSHHPIKVRQKIKSRAKGKAVTGRSAKSKKDYLVGKSGGGTQSAKSGGTQPSKKPTVVIRKDGLLQEAADMLAQSAAKDIAKRQLIISGECEGLPDAKLHSKLKLKEGLIDLMGFGDVDYVVSTLVHSFDADSEGFKTEITALTKPELES